jgi:hypothetical protein
VTLASRQRLQAAAGAAALLCSFAIAAAPLDALLTARPDTAGGSLQLELAIDHANRALDLGRDGVDAPARPGSYRGQHLLTTWRARDSLWLSAGLWRRDISDGVDLYGYRSWQASGLWRFAEGAGPAPALALRLSAWGNAAGATETHTPVQMPGAVLDSVKITRPSDRQWQLDGVATWQPTPALDLSLFGGIGVIQLAYGALSATTTRNGCHYDLAFNGNDIFGTLASPCSAAGGVILQFYDSSGDYGVDVAKEIAWHGQFVQLGANAVWRQGAWTLQGGLLYHHVRRADVDAILAARGEAVYQHNSVVTLDAAWALQPRMALFLRGQVSGQLFFNDLPLTYNSATSDSFGKHFSLLTLGLRASF